MTGNQKIFVINVYRMKKKDVCHLRYGNEKWSQMTFIIH
jgi:hypothetical protein